MRLRSILTICLTVSLPVLACAAPETSAKPTASETPATSQTPQTPPMSEKPMAAPAAEAFHRVDLKPTRSQGEPIPYTLEVPVDWQVREIEGFPGLWIGPADATPPQDPRLIWIHGSTVSMADPEKLVANIKASDAEKPEWSAPRVEVKEVGGIRGLLVQMDAGEGDKARSNLTLKLPLQNLAIDFVATASREEFAKNLPLYERILLSVRPAETAKP
jgi:hypothetical protein